MSYNKHSWQTGEVITAIRLNNMEDGIANPDEVIIGEYVDNWLESHPEAITIEDGTIDKNKLANNLKEELNNITILQEKLGNLSELQTENKNSVIEAINEIKIENDENSQNILTNDIKNALLNIAYNIVYTNENGEDYYNALQRALFPSIGQE